MAPVMNTKQVILSAVLVDYLALTGWAIHAAGLQGIVDGISSPVGIQMAAELLLFFTAGAAFVYRDAKTHARHAAGWAASVMCTGIIGVLLYAITHPRLTSQLNARADEAQRRSLQSAMP